MLKHAETLRSCQDPAENELWQGPWPHTYHGQVTPKKGEGYQTGYMLNDYANEFRRVGLVEVFLEVGVAVLDYRDPKNNVHTYH